MYITVVLIAFFVLIVFLLSLYLVFIYPVNQVTHLGISNVSEKADLINEYRTTSIQLVSAFAQIFGGIAVGIGILFAWWNLVTVREDQITKSFTQAIDQLGNEKIAIKLGGIQGLERISKKNKEEYWPTIEYLTEYIRENSSVEDKKVTKQTKVSSDIQKALIVIGRRNKSSRAAEFNRLNLRKTWLHSAHIEEVHFEKARFEYSDLDAAFFTGAHLEGANFRYASLININFEGSYLQKAIFNWAKLQYADFSGANLQGASFQEANLLGAKNLTIDQLLEVKTLYEAKLDEDLRKQLEEKYPDKYQELINPLVNISSL